MFQLCGKTYNKVDSVLHFTEGNAVKNSCGGIRNVSCTFRN